MKKVNIKIDDQILNFFFREDSIGDVGVIKQIFVDKDYDVFGWAQGRALIDYHIKKSKYNKSLIIDAGANIGASVVFFKHRYPNSFVYSVEPDFKNWELLQKNTAPLGGVFNFLGGISSDLGFMRVDDPGSSNWGFRTELIDAKVVAEGGIKSYVKSIDIGSILKDPILAGMNPLILKIDIEGAEQYLFSGNIDWMDCFALIIIELHDWMLPFQGTSRGFLKALSQFDFDFIHKGENIFLFNRRLLQNIA
jgi:FkbM family methyltransferase